MTRQPAGRLLKARPCGLGKHLAHSDGSCCFAWWSDTAAHAASASTCIDSRTAGAMRHSSTWVELVAVGWTPPQP